MNTKTVLVWLSLGLVLGLAGIASPAEATDAERCLQAPQANGCHAGLPLAEYQLLLDQMTMHPEPEIVPLEVNEAEVYRYAFRRLNNPGGTQLYDGPNGNPIGMMPDGFTFVTTAGYQPGWVNIGNNQWVQESQTSVIQPSVFAGVELTPESLRWTLAWVLLPEYPAPYPGAEGDRERERLERYTRVSIFAEAEIDGLRWYLVGPDAWVPQTSIGKVVPTERPAGVKGRWFSVDLFEQVMVAYEDDTPVFATLISSGLPQWSTEEGTFRTWARLRGDNMNGAEGRSDFYSLDAVPWVLYFNEDIALHGAYWHDRFGYRSSRGCVNLTITDANWIWQWSLEAGYDLPYVHVFSSGVYDDALLSDE
ncbi:MAG: L,D-transpeptidase [Anaerolineales bacterium]